MKALASPTDQREGEFWGVKSDSETIFKGGSFASFSKRKGGREAMAGNLGARKLFSDIFINI